MRFTRACTILLTTALVACGGNQIRSVESGAGSNLDIIILPTRQAEIGYAVYNNPVKSLSLAVAFTADAVSQTRGRTLQERMGNPDIHTTFNAYLGEALAARGHTVSWSMPAVERTPRRGESVPREQQRDGFGLKERYRASGTPGQVQLDYAIQFLGYAAAGVTAEHPLRPTFIVNVRVVGADGRTVHFQNAVHYNPILAGGTALSVDADERFAAADWDALRNADPELLREAIDTALREVAVKLSQAL